MHLFAIHKCVTRKIYPQNKLFTQNNLAAEKLLIQHLEAGL